MFLESYIVLFFIFYCGTGMALLSAQIRKWGDFVDCSEFVQAHFNWALEKCDLRQKRSNLGKMLCELILFSKNFIYTRKSDCPSLLVYLYSYSLWRRVTD